LWRFLPGPEDILESQLGTIFQCEGSCFSNKRLEGFYSVFASRVRIELSGRGKRLEVTCRAD